MKKYYIAYGSNLNIRQMKMHCPTAEIVGTALIPGYELLFKGGFGSAYLTIEPKQGAQVPVVVWSVEPDDELALDRYEGYPSLYYKKDMTVTVKDINTGAERTVDAFVYIMHKEHKCSVPSWSYLQTCIEGYRSFGFDTAVLEEVKYECLRRGLR
ncbi:MAG: gamma-glutamylcyclotransferase [Clostridia bacterium]|nr:gamma-glutamylcyclotransferase [Clostridia bacterium]